MGALSRFVALGDSFTEGLDDLRPDGTPQGWADLVADVLCATEPDFHYANLAVRSLGVDAVVDRQVPAAVALRPDLASIAAGGNDILNLRFDLDHVAARMDEALATLRATGATTVVFAGFDPRAQLPFGRLLAARTAAYNDRVRSSAARYDVILVDLWSMPELRDPRLWSRDRLHMSAAGHRHVAAVVLRRLGRPVPASWAAAPDDVPTSAWLAARLSELSWSREHFAPWLVRKLRGRAVGDGRSAKLPTMQRWDHQLTDANQ